MKVQEVLQRTQEFFAKKSLPNPRIEAEILLSHGLGWERIQLYTKFDYPMSEAEVTKCRSLVQRRLTGEPLAYIVGHQDFYGRNFKVGPGVLIPRPETEELVELVKDYLIKGGFPQPKLADFGSGSGCIGITLCKEIKGAQVDLFENAPRALTMIASNINSHEVGDCTKLIEQNLDQAQAKDLMMRGHWQYQAIVANPPYIDERDLEIAEEVKEFEPPEALFAGDGGLAKIKSWGLLGLELLLPGGLMAIEMGWKQSEVVKAFFENQEDVAKVKIEKDFSGHNRFALIEKQNFGPIA